MVKNMLIYFCSVALFLDCNAQKNDSTFVIPQAEFYSLIYKNTCLYAISKLKINPDECFNFYDELANLPILDSNEYYLINCKKRNDIKIGDTDVYEFSSSMDSFYFEKNKYGNLYHFSTSNLKKAGKGLVAFKKGFGLIFVSGYFFLSDLNKLIDFSNYKKNDWIEYVKIRYFNLDPFDIDSIEDGVYIFKSKISPIEQKYKLTISKQLDNFQIRYIEHLVEVF